MALYAVSMNIGVVGASGYSGGELLRLLLGHPTFSIHYIAAGSNAGEEIISVHPHLIPLRGRKFETTDVDLMNACELVFFALPHGESAKYVAQLSDHVKVVDLGADFRLQNPKSWEKYYGGVHAGTWDYAIPELPGKRFKIAHASRVANPGCYATAIALGAAPAVAEGIVDVTDIVIVAASGTTGAGRSAKVNLLGSEVMNSLSSYKFGGVHQHTPEIEETLQELTDSEVNISFTPVLAPMPRGILATITAKIIGRVDIVKVREIYGSFFKDETFVSLLPEGIMPQTSSVLGSNSVQIQIAIDSHTNRLVISVAIDNLGKGAAGQALQNANIMVGLEESLGLSPVGTP